MNVLLLIADEVLHNVVFIINELGGGLDEGSACAS